MIVSEREMPLTLAKIANLLGRTRRMVEIWQWYGQLPPPDGIVGGQPTWWRDTIEAWQRTAGLGLSNLP